MIDGDKIAKWFKHIYHVEEAMIEEGIENLRALEQAWCYDESRDYYLVYILSEDSYTYNKVGIVSGNLRFLKEKLKIEFQLIQRGADSSIAGKYFFLIPCFSETEAEEIKGHLELKKTR